MAPASVPESVKESLPLVLNGAELSPPMLSDKPARGWWAVGIRSDREVDLERQEAPAVSGGQFLDLAVDDQATAGA